MCTDQYLTTREILRRQERSTFSSLSLLLYFITFLLPRIALLITMAKKKIGRPIQSPTPASPTRKSKITTDNHHHIPTTRPPGMRKDLYEALHENDYLPELYASFEKHRLDDPRMPREEKEWKIRTLLTMRGACGYVRKQAGCPPSLKSVAAIKVCSLPSCNYA